MLCAGRNQQQHSLLHPNQHGGRAGHSTTTTLIQMHEQWMNDLEDGKTVAVTMIDQSAAFDVCNHQLLLQKLRLLGVHNVDWVASYLSGRSQSVAIGAALSAPLPLPPASVVQGGVGSGILYNIMTCDLPDVIHTGHQVSLEDTEHHCQEDGDMVTFVDSPSPAAARCAGGRRRRGGRPSPSLLVVKRSGTVIVRCC